MSGTTGHTCGEVYPKSYEHLMIVSMFPQKGRSHHAETEVGIQMATRSCRHECVNRLCVSWDNCQRRRIPACRSRHTWGRHLALQRHYRPVSVVRSALLSRRQGISKTPSSIWKWSFPSDQHPALCSQNGTEKYFLYGLRVVVDRSRDLIYLKSNAF